MATERSVEKYLARFHRLKSADQQWEPLYTSLSETFLMREVDYTNAPLPGRFILDNIFDNTGQFAAHVFASVLLSMLWPDAERTFNIVPARQLRKRPGVEEYFRAVTARQQAAMGRVEAGLVVAFMGYLLDQGIFGISGVGNFDGPEDDWDAPVVYEAWDVKGMHVEENPQGFVDTVFFEIRRSARQVADDYVKPGDRVAAVVTAKVAAGKGDEIVRVLKIIEPRPKAEREGKKGVAGMAYRTVHIDIDNKIIMRQGGYQKMPVHVGRMFKRMEETRGRSCGMTALPDAISLNGLSEAVLVATEKQLDPPLGVLDDGRLGGGTIDTSAGALNVFNAAGRIGGEKPVFPLVTVGELQSAEKQMQRLEQKVMQGFFLDRLLDLNNKTQMTAFEASIRNRLRGESLGSIFARQIMEVITPTIEDTFDRMFNKGYFGDFPGVKGPGVEQRRKWKALTGTDDMVVPDVVRRAVEAGLNIYEIEYVSPAQRFMEAEKLQGAFTAADAVAALAPIFPSMPDGVDPDEYLRRIWKFTGAPIEGLRTIEDLKRFRAEQAQRQNAVVALEAADKMADITNKNAQARAALGTTGA